MNKIKFNDIYRSKESKSFLEESLQTGHISGDGKFTELCANFFEEKYGFKNSLLTTSCTDALEMAAILLDIKPGDEVIAPSYTFVSTVNAFVLRGAFVRFVDSSPDNPNIDPAEIKNSINSKTKAIIIVHYAGVACDFDEIKKIAGSIPIIEDAAQAIDSYYHNKSLGSLGTFSTFSFHETKNITSGEGGMIVINDETYLDRALIIREKGTNRSAFYKGEVDKYGWCDIGSSFLMSDLNAAQLYSQLINLDKIQSIRRENYEIYKNNLTSLENDEFFQIPEIPEFASNNAHMFYISLKNVSLRDEIMKFLKTHNIQSAFHYLPLHLSEFYKKKYQGKELSNAIFWSNSIIRLPLHTNISKSEIDYVCSIFKKALVSING